MVLASGVGNEQLTQEKAWGSPAKNKRTGSGSRNTQDPGQQSLTVCTRPRIQGVTPQRAVAETQLNCRRNVADAYGRGTDSGSVHGLHVPLVRRRPRIS